MLADVGKMLEFDKNASGQPVKGHFGDMLRHPFSGVALCYKHGIPAEVMHIVATHSHEGDKVERTIESMDLPPRGLHRFRHREGAGEDEPS